MFFVSMLVYVLLLLSADVDCHMHLSFLWITGICLVCHSHGFYIVIVCCLLTCFLYIFYDMKNSKIVGRFLLHKYILVYFFIVLSSNGNPVELSTALLRQLKLFVDLY